MQTSTKATLLVLVMLAGVALLSNCSNSEPLNSTVESAKEAVDDKVNEVTGSSRCAVSERLTKTEAGKLCRQWSQAYYDAWGHMPDSTDQFRAMQRAPMEQLFRQFPDADGVRLYFGFHGPIDNFPAGPDLSVANVDTNTCKDQLGDSVLIFNPTKVHGHSWESIPVAHSSTDAWAIELTSANMPITGEPFLPVYAYTYKKSQLQAILDDRKVQEIRAYFALRKVQGEPEPSWRVDVVFEGYPQSNSSSAHYVDFALPCPHNCDNGSPLMPIP